MRTVNAGIYALPAPEIFERVRRLEPDNAQGELLPHRRGRRARWRRHAPCAWCALADPDEALGVNSRQELAAVHRRLVERKLQALMAAGVTVLEPHRTRVDDDVSVGADTVIHPDVTLLGRSVVGAGCTLSTGSGCATPRWATARASSPTACSTAPRSARAAASAPSRACGPARASKRGPAWATSSRSRSLAPRRAAPRPITWPTSATPTSATGANVGAGAITCNYDGERKHPTKIGAGAFVGSDTMLVAPVEVGEGAVTAAGSVITRDVPAGALAVGRARQKVVEGWTRRRGRRGAKKSTPPSTPET